MNEILSVGLILVAALLAGHLAQSVRVPEVTGYLLVGVVIGPAALDLISYENIETLGFLSDVALGLSSVLGLGLIGVSYAMARTVGKLAGSHIGLRGQDVPPMVRRHLGFCLVSSSSLAVGLTIQIRSAFPEYAATVTGIVLAAVVIFEIVGPLLTRRALLKTGEAKTMPQPLQHAMSTESPA